VRTYQAEHGCATRAKGLGHSSPCLKAGALWPFLGREYASAPWLRLLLPDVLRVCALIAMARERWTEAEEALEEAIMLSNEMPSPWGELKALYVYGQLHEAIGEPVKACEAYEWACTICDHLGEGLYRPHIERALAILTSG
jgi:tetratricopeptide (TPR) repeat protein